MNSRRMEPRTFYCYFYRHRGEPEVQGERSNPRRAVRPLDNLLMSAPKRVRRRARLRLCACLAPSAVVTGRLTQLAANSRLAAAAGRPIPPVTFWPARVRARAFEIIRQPVCLFV